MTERDEASTPTRIGLGEGLGPLPEPVAWFRAPYGTLEPNPLFRVTGPQSLEWAVACYTADQLRAAVAAERERYTPTEAAIKAAIYEQCPDFDEWHEGPSLDDVLAIVRRVCGPNA